MAKPVFYIYMGQGIVADLRNYTLQSGQFSSCAPIVMFNEDTSIAGLYHLGGCDDLADFQTTNLKKMITLVQPTQAYLFTGKGVYDHLKSAQIPATGHLGPVELLLINNEVWEILQAFEGKSAYGSITVSMTDDRLKIEEACSTDATEMRTEAAFRDLPGAVTLIGERDLEALGRWV